MFVGYNVDGDKAHHMVDVDCDDPDLAFTTVKEMLRENGVKARRVLAVIQGGKTSSAPVLTLPPTVA